MADGRPGLFQLDRDAETSPRRLAMIVAAGLAALLLLLWLFSGGDSSPHDTAQPAPVPAPSSVSSAPSSPAPVPPTGSVAELRLHGVMGTGEDGAAIVSTGAGAQRLVRVGRDLVPGVPLLAVAADHILVRERGREVRLSFAEDGQGGTASAASPGGGSRSGQRGDEASRRESLEYQAALAPVRVDGRHAGYQFRSGSMPEMFRDAGLQDGDVVLRVGGLGLEDADDVAGIPRRIRQRGQVEIEILRDGERRTIIMDAR
ncbi:type II secretion system protein N [Parasphingopyxis lamellibrachiae]|uniref:Type II secretion system protein C n=1 Tax=Parasphingopyxis lamellibrachiae TaxID=680125 RepID=A0A3D9FIX7_9SPHN|nr:type II secretion system protein N [Parasphingopyxis lamellibrachiae]RED17754.1 type II secretion system protein C [Parasphingopyxis lamellibrachiae]